MATPSRRFLPLIVAGQIPLNGKGRAKCPAVLLCNRGKVKRNVHEPQVGPKGGSRPGPGMRLSAAELKPDHASDKSSH